MSPGWLSLSSLVPSPGVARWKVGSWGLGVILLSSVLSEVPSAEQRAIITCSKFAGGPHFTPYTCPAHPPNPRFCYLVTSKQFIFKHPHLAQTQTSQRDGAEP